MGAEEKSLTHGAVADFIADVVGIFKCVDEVVALGDSNPGGTPHIESHGIVAESGEVGGLDGFYTVVTTAGAYVGVPGHYVEAPYALVVEV